MLARTRRRGYTLFEVILVVCVLVMLGAICIPSLRGMSTYWKLQGGVDSVRSAWAHARARAIAESRPYRFSVEPGGTHFRVAPDRQEYWTGGTGPASDPEGNGLIIEKSVPGGVRFTINGDSASVPPETTAEFDDKTPPSGEWTTAVVFKPDGTANTDLRIVFRIRGVRPTAVQLRGLTGGVSVQTLSE